MLRVYGRKDSINVMKVLWACDELGVAYERIDVGGAFGFDHVPRYDSLNPNRRVPTVDDDGFVLWESNVILRYLDATHAPPALRLDGRARWIGEQWMDWQQTTVLPPMRTVFQQRVRTPPERRDATAIRAAHETLCATWPVLDAHLARSPFVAGDRFSVADIPLCGMAYRWYALAGDDRPATPAVDDWWRRLRERPGYRAHLTLPLT
jgi:glutathione S-transferase